MFNCSIVAYAASTMSEKRFSETFADSKMMPGQQAQKFNRLLMRGLAENGIKVNCVSAPPITVGNTKRKYVNIKNDIENGVEYKYLPVINISRLKNILCLISSFFNTLQICMNNRSVVVCDVLNISVSLGATLAAKVLKRQSVGIVTDVPELMVTGHSEKQVKLCHKVISNCDKYVFLTEAMNERLNPKGKPYIIIEGVCDSHIDDHSVTQLENGIKKCFYAGLLDAEYGVKNMVDGFLEADIVGAEMHICGKGPYEEELKSIAEKDKRVVFHGSVLNKEVVFMEKNCDLLINPRPVSGEFTKFSFPSKILEYMSSGTAALATELPGIPIEYFDYLLKIDEDTPTGIAKAIENALSLNKSELSIVGRKAKKWVIANKSQKQQGLRLLELINQ